MLGTIITILIGVVAVAAVGVMLFFWIRRVRGKAQCCDGGSSGCAGCSMQSQCKVKPAKRPK